MHLHNTKLDFELDQPQEKKKKKRPCQSKLGDFNVYNQVIHKLYLVIVKIL